ncbi:hypothetical protein PANT_20c00081 [Moesziomyces antarcticus T-34]|uniref:C2H2-type domain-containing protein n=1 Tax=Pseudozyma antarctica (strain T-34) TaxID=1151754 RepID=M9MFP3_PSEA3|nr:hypothetical protein PANT_20c00081 [Moesziomyces antarcticus T-34]
MQIKQNSIPARPVQLIKPCAAGSFARCPAVAALSRPNLGSSRCLPARANHMDAMPCSIGISDRIQSTVRASVTCGAALAPACAAAAHTSKAQSNKVTRTTRSVSHPSRNDADVNYQASQVDTDTGLLERALSSSTASGSSEADILAPSFAAFEAPTAVLTALSNAASSTPDSQSWCSTPSLAPDLEQLLTSLTQDASTSPSSDGSAVGKVVETLSHPQLAPPPQPNDGNMSCNASTHAEETGSNKQAGADAPLRKRRRKRYDQVLRIFACPFPGCPKSYGKLQHLNTHLDHMKHGDKRCLQQYRNGSRSLSRAQHSSWQP